MPAAKHVRYVQLDLAPFFKSSSRGSPDQKDWSKFDASVRAALNDINFLNIIDQDQNDDPINIIITILTVIVARPKSPK